MAPPPKGSTRFSNSATKWRPSIQLKEPLGHISHSNHSSHLIQDARDFWPLRRQALLRVKRALPFGGDENRSLLALWVKIILLFAYKEIRDQKVPEMCQSHSQTWRKPNRNPGFCDFKAFIVAILSRLTLHCSNTVKCGTPSNEQASPRTSDSS